MRNKILYLKKRIAHSEGFLYDDEFFGSINEENKNEIALYVNRFVNNINKIVIHDGNIKHLISILNITIEQFNGEPLGLALKRLCLVLFWEYYKRDDINSFFILNEILLTLYSHISRNNVKAIAYMAVLKNIKKSTKDITLKVTYILEEVLDMLEDLANPIIRLYQEMLLGNVFSNQNINIKDLNDIATMLRYYDIGLNEFNNTNGILYHMLTSLYTYIANNNIPITHVINSLNSVTNLQPSQYPHIDSTLLDILNTGYSLLPSKTNPNLLNFLLSLFTAFLDTLTNK
jgi:hypothetical protein